MFSYKSDFPLLHKQDIIYLDSAATTQKPQAVIDAINHYLTNYNANIHRGTYGIAEQSEELYYQSKVAYASLINASSDEIIYTHNATYAYNILVQTLIRNQILQQGDTILLGIREHHANIVPRQIAAEQVGFNIQYIQQTADYDIDMEDFQCKYTEQVKLVSLSACSNVTGTVFDLANIAKKLRPDSLLIIDGSQITGKIPVDVQALGCDAFIATAHKMMALTGLGMLYLRAEHCNTRQPPLGGGGIIETVTTSGHTYTDTTDKREPGTPNVLAAVSLHAACQYIELIGIDAIQTHDRALTQHFLEYYHAQDSIQLIGKDTTDDRLAIFSFIHKGESNHRRVGELLALHNICIRCGGHCTYPLRTSLSHPGACRASCYLYNTKKDIDLFFKSIL